EVQLDSPRFDTALSDAAYALADELVALVHDVDTVRVEATVDDQKRLIDLDFSAVFGDQKAWSSRALAERGKHEGAPPDEFWKLPADAQSAGYTEGSDPATYERLGAGIGELADAYLEHEKVSKATRERVTRLLQTYFRWDGEDVRATGSDPEPAAKGAKSAGNSDWLLVRVDHPPATLKGSPADLLGILDDRELRATVARALKVSEKDLPSGRMVPLHAPGVPAGTKALVIKLPTELGPLFGHSMGLAAKDAAPSPHEFAIAVVPSGTEALVATAQSTPVLAARLGEALSGKAPTLATRTDLAPMRELDATSAGFTTLLGIVTSAAGRNGSNPGQVAASLPHRATAPLIVDFWIDPQTGRKARWHLAIPAGVFEDLPGLLPLFAASFADHSTP
ncbi:MAG TPA: hypothetical protein VMI54_19940, partial [Polyangiaceae bacterium]|nr:hypothetical protein [Polyangiaceae bacterium]